METKNRDETLVRKDEIAEARLILDERTRTLSVEIPVQDDLSSIQLKNRQCISPALAGILDDGFSAGAELLNRTPHDSDWAGEIAVTLDRFGYRVNDEIARLVQAEAVTKDRDVEIRLRHVLGQIFANRGEVSLGLEEIDRDISLIRSDEKTYALHCARRSCGPVPGRVTLRVIERDGVDFEQHGTRGALPKRRGSAFLRSSRPRHRSAMIGKRHKVSP